ncbi:hypothetical protein EVAR_10811_1 [Eumeta japonica]|uniref:Uncharacterized protein n=1 Tax=Eumeta variegata TaxID=151549 RepID=A0A4C1Y6S2_EUMVA|nr:hypothetical protein EVAR_10811_1 [Eumeta japonica]
MRLLHSMCGVSRNDRCRNSDVGERCGLKEDVVTGVERGMLRWFGHLERRNEMKSVERMCVAERSARGALENPMHTILWYIKKEPNVKRPKPTSLREKVDGMQFWQRALPQNPILEFDLEAKIIDSAKIDRWRCELRRVATKDHVAGSILLTNSLTKRTDQILNDCIDIARTSELRSRRRFSSP